MTNEKFTDEASIRRLKKGNKPVEYYYGGKQTLSRRLGIRVSPKNKKTFLINYYADGKTKKYTLGTFEFNSKSITLAKAKKLANSYADRDPIAEGAQAKIDAVNALQEAQEQEKQDKIRKMSERTMTDLWEEYSSLPKYTQKAESNRKEELRKWEKNIKSTLGDIPVKDITPVIINDMLKALVTKAPVATNRLYSLLKVMFKPALAGGWITIHPMQHLDRPSKEKARKRILSDVEIKAVWPHLDKLAANPRDILKLILLTAQRPGEVSSMKWSDVNLNEALWTQSENKTDVVNLVPLSPQTIEVLKARKRGRGYTEKQMWMTRSEYVFPSRYNKAKGAKDGHTKYTKNARKHVHESSGVKNWTAHDMRRTSRTIMSRLKIKQHVRERVLNHSQGGVAGVYDQYDYLDEKRDALRKLGNEMARIVGLDIEKGTVIQLRQA
jgi:integrase